MHSEPISKATVQYCSLAELDDDEQDLIIEARASTQLSHSPYSHYCVGCAIQLKDGQKVHGANTENASYGLSCCAERTTIFAANNMGRKRDIRKIAVTARPAGVNDYYVGTTPVAPCGACRQVIKESEDLAGTPIIILMDCCDDRRIARVVGISSLLPFAFGPSDLGIVL
jgi:cytidine deaminase